MTKRINKLHAKYLLSFRAQSRNPVVKSTEAFKQRDFSMRSQGYLVEMTKENVTLGRNDKRTNKPLTKKGVSPKDFCLQKDFRGRRKSRLLSHTLNALRVGITSCFDVSRNPVIKSTVLRIIFIKGKKFP